MAGQSNKFRALCALFDRDYVPNDGPKIPEYDQLLEALKREHGEAGGRSMQSPDLGCVCAGALMATAWQFFVVCAATDWQPHKIVVASAITLGITGWIWLWDELP